MIRLNRKRWPRIACPRVLLGNNGVRHVRIGVVAKGILSLSAMLAASWLVFGCHSEKSPTPDALIGPQLHVIVSAPVQPLPRSPPVDQGDGELGPGSTSLGPQFDLGPQFVYSSRQMYRPPIPDMDRDGLWNEDVQRQANSPSVVQPNLSFSHPLWQDGRNDWIASAKVCDTAILPNAIFTGTQQPLPAALWNVGFTTTYRHVFEKDWVGGVSVSVETVSEKPFQNLSQMTEGVKASFKVPQSQHDFWLFSVSYASSNEWSLPISKVEYAWQPSGRLWANIGIVLPITDHPLDDLSLDASVKFLSPVEP